jgi:hypothetical protein
MSDVSAGLLGQLDPCQFELIANQLAELSYRVAKKLRY